MIIYNSTNDGNGIEALANRRFWGVEMRRNRWFWRTFRTAKDLRAMLWRGVRRGGGGDGKRYVNFEIFSCGKLNYRNESGFEAMKSCQCIPLWGDWDRVFRDANRIFAGGYSVGSAHLAGMQTGLGLDEGKREKEKQRESGETVDQHVA